MKKVIVFLVLATFLWLGGMGGSAFATTVSDNMTYNGVVTFKNAVSLSGSSASWAVGASIVFEGATADAYETTLTATDPTADATVTIPNTTSAVMVSSLTTNDVDAANSVTGASNALVFEGATANAFETSIVPTDATADRTVTVPNASGAIMISTLTTNAPDIANSVTGGTNQLIFEGSSADANESIITATNATSDRTFTLPDASGYLAVTENDLQVDNLVVRYNGTTGALIQNSPVSIDDNGDVTGLYSSLEFEGATADASETTVTVTDPTGDRTITIPDYTGSLPLIVSQSSIQNTIANATVDIGPSAVTGILTDGSTIKWTVTGTITGANAAKNVILYIDDGAIVTLATQAATTGDYQVECYMYAVTAASAQDAWCKMIVATGADVEFDFATDTTDFSSSKTVKMQIVSGNASDTITSESVIVEYWNK